MVKVIQLILATVYILLHFLFSAVFGLIPAGVCALAGKKRAANSLLLFNGRLLSQGIIASLGGRVHISGLEHLEGNGERICFISNHQSYADIPLIVSHLPMLAGFVAKKELLRIPILSSWMRALGCVYIDRSSARSSVKAILDGVSMIKSGHPLVIFPEGTRSKGPKYGTFKSGSLKLATRAKAVIIPLTIENTYQLLEHRKGGRGLHTDIYLTIHPPVPSAELDEHQMKGLPDRIFGTIEEQLSLPGR